MTPKPTISPAENRARASRPIEEQATFCVIGRDGRSPPAQAGLRAVNWRLWESNDARQLEITSCQSK